MKFGNALVLFAFSRVGGSPAMLTLSGLEPRHYDLPK